MDDDVELANQTGTFFVQKMETIRSEHDNMAQGLPSLFDDRTPVAPPPLSKFSLLSEEARKLISSSAKKSCTLDPLPTSLVVDCIDVLLPIITNMINLSLESGLFVDLPTSRAQSFLSYFLCFLRQKRAREEELDLFPLQKIASSDVILAQTICFPVACVVACVCRRELSKYVKTNK